MSEVLWCDKGEHAFSAADPDRQHFTQTRKVEVPVGNGYWGKGLVERNGRSFQERQEVTEELDICGGCWEKQNFFRPQIEDAKVEK